MEIFKNVANSLNANYVIVRPDHIFQLITNAKGLAENPCLAAFARK
jgi:hypothetical protein